MLMVNKFLTMTIAEILINPWSNSQDFDLDHSIVKCKFLVVKMVNLSYYRFLRFIAQQRCKRINFKNLKFDYEINFKMSISTIGQISA